jgi:hypothetical protein
MEIDNGHCGTMVMHSGLKKNEQQSIGKMVLPSGFRQREDELKKSKEEDLEDFDECTRSILMGSMVR